MSAAMRSFCSRGSSRRPWKLAASSTTCCTSVRTAASPLTSFGSTMSMIAGGHVPMASSTTCSARALACVASSPAVAPSCLAVCVTCFTASIVVHSRPEDARRARIASSSRKSYVHLVPSWRINRWSMKSRQPTNVSPMTVEPALIRVDTLCISASGAPGGRYISSPSMRKKERAVGSKPAACSRAGQLESLRSASTTMRSHESAGASTIASSCASLYRWARGTSTSKTLTDLSMRGRRHALASSPAARTTNCLQSASSASHQRLSKNMERLMRPTDNASLLDSYSSAAFSRIFAPSSPASDAARVSGPAPTLLPITGALDEASVARIAATHCAVGNAASQSSTSRPLAIQRFQRATPVSVATVAATAILVRPSICVCSVGRTGARKLCAGP
mmetsp:Transcript_12244/g.30969  ORF Transcript_12244/g.30969 Transcript_12244/m.30969 type:complete len:392 (+) Transcript_12244:364-1539(+)